MRRPVPKVTAAAVADIKQNAFQSRALRVADGVSVESLVTRGFYQPRPHFDQYVPRPHIDHADHSDAHQDVLHNDAHSDAFFDVMPHLDDAPRHIDTHVDTAHNDGHYDHDDHGDHVDSDHVDNSHDDSDHTDNAHDDGSHDDNAHDDTHNDAPHDDTHDDTGHDDTHDDTGHDDTAHDDEFNTDWNQRIDRYVNIWENQLLAAHTRQHAATKLFFRDLRGHLQALQSRMRRGQ